MARKKKIKKKFVARKGAPFKEEDAQQIGEFIDKIPIKSTRNILKKIRENPDHSIGKYIEWDDNTAAEEYRLHQVRNIVNHIEIELIYLGKVERTKGFQSIDFSMDPDRKKYGRIYIDVIQAFEDDYSKIRIIDRAKKELENWVWKYKMYNELQNIRKAIQDFLDKKP